MQSRAGITLLEVLIVMAIFALIVGLLLPGIQKTRESAARINGSNNIKQITLAMQQYTDEHEDCLPLGNGYKSTFYFILPWLEHGNYYNAVETGARPYSNDYEMILYISPIDPTLSNPEVRNGKASYAYNALVYVPEIRKDLKATSTNTFLDGTSNTIVLTEHYAFNCDGTQFDWMWAKPARTLENAVTHQIQTIRRSSFADVGDVAPNPVSPPALTFQFRPTIPECNPRIPQTPFEAGLLVGLADGSVRLISPSISPITFWAAVFWSAVTPTRDFIKHERGEARIPSLAILYLKELERVSPLTPTLLTAVVGLLAQDIDRDRQDAIRVSL